jgi:hypothetical protein
VAFFLALIGQMANSVWRILAHKFGLNFDGEIKLQIFQQTLCVAIFSLGKQSLVKSTLHLMTRRSMGQGRIKELVGPFDISEAKKS